MGLEDYAVIHRYGAREETRTSLQKWGREAVETNVAYQ